MKKLILLLVLVLSVGLSQTYSFNNQDLKFERIGLSEGLSNGAISQVFEDSYGYIWVATQGGLNRYDGQDFKIYKNTQGDSNSILDDWIWKILQDKAGNLWIATGKGLSRYDYKTDSFENFKGEKNAKIGLNAEIIRTIYEYDDNTLWLATEGGGINIFYKDTKKFGQLMHDDKNNNSIGANRIFSIISDDDGNIWIGTDGAGLDKYNKKSKKITHYKFDPKNPDSLSDNVVNVVYFDSQNRLWIGTEYGGLNLFNDEKNTFKRYKNDPNKPGSISFDAILTVNEDNSGNLWVGVKNAGKNGGLNLYDRQKDIFYNFKHSQGDLTSLVNNAVQYIFQDTSGAFWVASATKGLNKFPAGVIKFPHYKWDSEDEESLKGFVVRAIFEDSEGNIWFGMDEYGVSIFNQKTNKFTHLEHNDNDKNSLGSNNVTSFAETKDEILIGTWDKGLNRYNKKTKKITRENYDKNNLDKSNLSLHNNLINDSIQAIMVDKEGNIWFGFEGGGLNKYYVKTKKYEYFVNNPSDSKSISNNNVQSKALIEDENGNIWVGVWDGGLNKFNPKTKEFIHYKHNDDTNSLNDNRVISLAKDNFENVLWIGTWGGGLSKFEIDKNKFTNFTTNNGLPNNVIYGINQDKSGNIWVSTNEGISKLDKKTLTFTNYTTKDGLQSSQFFWGASEHTRDGKIIFGGVNGFNIFEPEKIHFNEYVPNIILSEIKNIDTGKSYYYNVENNSNLEFSYKDKTILFNFKTLDFNAPNNIKYAYKLEGFNSDWIYTDAKNANATYTNLNGGRYVFRIKSTNSDGVWVNNEQQYNIYVSTHPLKTWYAILIYFLVLGVVGGCFVRRKFRKKDVIIREKEEKINEYKALNEKKDEFINIVSHELRTPITSIKGYLSMILDGDFGELNSNFKQAISTIYNSSSRLLDMVNDMLDLTKLESGKMNLNIEKVNLNQMLDLIYSENSNNSLILSKNLNFKITKLQKDVFVNIDKNKFNQVIINLIGNSFKFTNANGTVELRLSQLEKQQKIRISVIDDGIGIAKEDQEKIFEKFSQIENSLTRNQNGTGLGLCISREILKAFNSDLLLESQVGQGSTFYFDLDIIN